ncbi:MAG TPA: hypothetical protein VN519_06385 [Bryobacteraceae bacterium]|nr:hypothetical protein [Bryobacteraceae bacterium]
MPTINEIKERDQWLKELKAGDRVAVCRSQWTPVICTVSRTTPTQIIIDRWGDGRFSRDDGREMRKTDRWSGRATLDPVTQEIRDEIEREQNLGKVNRMDWKKLTNDQLRRAVAITEEVKADA